MSYLISDALIWRKLPESRYMEATLCFCDTGMNHSIRNKLNFHNGFFYEWKHVLGINRENPDQTQIKVSFDSVLCAVKGFM